MRLRATIVAAVMAASAMTCVFAQGSTAATVSKRTHHLSICATSYNPYRESVSVLRSCGDVILRLRRVTPLPGGGKAYDYGAYTQLVPPPHFNVLKASDRQLREYGIPTRRKFGSRWYAFARHMRHSVRPVPYMIEIPPMHTAALRVPSLACSYPGCTFNWSGHVAYQGHSYNGVSAGWYEPDFVSSSCSTTAFFQWVGIGGFNGGPLNLGQDGTAFGYPGLGSHQAWIETSENNVLSPPVAINLAGNRPLNATVDKKFSASTFWNNSGDSKYDYDLANSYTGLFWTGESREIDSVDLSSAEVIAERPTINGGLPGLPDYQQFQVTSPDALWGTSGGSLFVNLPVSDETVVDMEDTNGKLMSAPGPLDLSTSDFSNVWYNCN